MNQPEPTDQEIDKFHNDVMICQRTFDGIIRGMIMQNRMHGAIFKALYLELMYSIARTSCPDELYKTIMDDAPRAYADAKEIILQQKKDGYV